MSKTTATGARHDAPVYVPSEDEFGIEQYLSSSLLTDVGSALVRSPLRGLGDVLMAEVDVRYLWRRKASKSGGRIVRAKCAKIGPRERHFAKNADFVIEVAADDARDRGMSQIELEALIYHELLHIGVEQDDSTGEFTFSVTPHDVELFADEVEHYGLWRTDLEHAAAAFEQAGMAFETGVIDTAYKAQFSPITITGDESIVPGRIIDAATGEMGPIIDVRPLSTDQKTEVVFSDPFLIDGATGDEFDTGDLPPDEGELTTNLFDGSVGDFTLAFKEGAPKLEVRDLNVGGENFYANIGADPMAPDDPDWVWLAERQREELALWESDPARAIKDESPAELVKSIEKLNRKIAHDTMNDNQRRSAQMQRLARVRKLERMTPVPPEYMAYVVSKGWDDKLSYDAENDLYVSSNDDAYAVGVVEDEYATIITARGPAAREAMQTHERGPATANVPK